MNDRQQITRMMKDEFERWEHLLNGLTEEEIIDRTLPAGLSIKDVVAHLWAWQQRSNARMQAALADREPIFTG